MLFLHFLSGVVWVPYSDVPSLSVVWCFSSLLCCIFIICGLFLCAYYSSVRSLSASCCLSFLLKCTFTICGLFFELLLCCSFTICVLLLLLPTLLYLHYLLVVVWVPYSVVLSISVGCCLMSLLCCSFTICELLLELPTQLYLYYPWVVVWVPYSVVPSLSMGCCLSSLLSCTFTIHGLLFELPILLFLHFLSGVVWVPYSVVPSLSMGCYLMSLIFCTFTICGFLFELPGPCSCCIVEWRFFFFVAGVQWSTDQHRLHGRMASVDQVDQYIQIRPQCMKNEICISYKLANIRESNWKYSAYDDDF